MRIAVLGIDGMLDSGLASVLDVLSSANALHGDIGLPTAPFDVTVTAKGSSVRTAHGHTVPAKRWREVIDQPPDLLVMPSLGVRPPAEVIDVVRRHPALEGIESLCQDGVGMAASCSGTFFLAEAGILDGLQATTSWWLADAFRARYPQIALDETQIVVAQGNIMTAAAGFAHVDLGLALVARLSPSLAELTAAYVVAGRRTTQVGLNRMTRRGIAHPLLIAFEHYVRDHLDTAPTIARIAASIGTSERHLQRLMAQVLAMTPSEYVQELRVEHAMHALSTTDRSTEAIAQSVGYRNADTLRAVLRRRRGVSIRELRRAT